MSKPTRRPTRRLFKQYDDAGKEDLSVWRDAFVEICDPTEYEGALALVGSWDEWLRFKREWPEFRDVILPRWLDEVEVRIRSGAVKNLCAQAKDPKGAAAAKWLAEGKYIPKQAGRPSKSQIEKEARVQARVANETDDDVARVMEHIEIEGLPN